MKTCIDVTYDKMGRIYKYDDGSEYYSVTTMLGNTSKHDSIDNWRYRIGEEEADRICKTAAHLGEEFHKLGEDFLLGKPLSKVNPVSASIFKQVLPLLKQHVTKVHAVEEALLTEKYGLAGRADAVVDWDDELMILDFKLLNNADKTWLSDYWCQTAIYAQCWDEMYGVKPKRTVLVIGDKTNIAGVFHISKVAVWEQKVVARVKKFKRLIEEQ